MSQVIGICGKTGTGKTTSLRNLDPNTTYIIDVAGKPLPWKGSKNQFNKAVKNYVNTDQYKDIMSILKAISNNRPEIKTIIIDDFQYIMANHFLSRASEKTYDKFTDIGVEANGIIIQSKKLRDDISVFILTHSDDSERGSKMKTVGKLLDNYITLEGLFTTFLYTQVIHKKGESPQFKFVTQHLSDHYPAKSPMGMFETPLIDNDLEFVRKQVEEYFI